MLVELYLLHTYFEEPSALMYEEDVAGHFGWPAVRDALDSGLIERRRVPCAGGADKWICRLSPAGFTAVTLHHGP